MSELILVLGVQLSGKSRLSSELAKFTQYTRFSIDGLRLNMYGYLSSPKDWNSIMQDIHNREIKKAYDVLFQTIGHNIRLNYPIIVEMPHLGSREEELISQVQAYQTHLKIIWCHISKDSDEEICRRISNRSADPSEPQIRLEDYRMFKERIRKPAWPCLEIDTSRPFEECLKDTINYIQNQSSFR
ncbi:ATP-binding protein [Candidatus Parcubacteria bacterium]|nr:ATP-binding protein [Candidatus Parcubacteria bacterium]